MKTKILLLALTFPLSTLLPTLSWSQNGARGGQNGITYSILQELRNTGTVGLGSCKDLRGIVSFCSMYSGICLIDYGMSKHELDQLEFHSSKCPLSE